ncbi:MAG: PilZ domain-containing protein [Planctomycetes bacterium]|nr:PilZ domain-containing protein [Planctomycetota bacterium]
MEQTTPSEATSAQRRRHGRVLCEDLSSSLGEVVNLSASGMRVRGAEKPPKVGSRLTIRIDAPDGALFAGTVVQWTRRIGLFRFEVGLRFEPITPQLQVSLNRLARFACRNETIMPSVRALRQESRPAA